MTDQPADNYAIYYADKLWTLLPAVYRALDTDELGAAGPLRELVNRVGFTTGALRRSIDRLWENQSIETCDEWAIPYIGALLDTRLVLGLDPSRQRLDVAHTIDYRRRKGTLGVLEEIASAITGWDARAVEFFRRLGRTRHGLDPAIGPRAAPGSDLAALHQAEGLIGATTRTAIGGFANLRNVNGAGLSRTAFDEFFHTADTRAPSGVFGWQSIPNLGIFVWRLLSLPAGPVTPVAVDGCPGWFCFDPTGRDIPLFAAQRQASDFGDAWVSPTQGQLPGPISQALLDADIEAGAAGLGLYPNLLSVALAGTPPIPLAASALTLRPGYGRFHYQASPPADLLATYCYGFPSQIGAGSYDRRGQVTPIPLPAPTASQTGGGAFAGATGGTVTIGDSLTYNGAAGLSVAAGLTLRSANRQRPLIRLPPGQAWVIDGAPGATLALDGLFLSGGDLVLSGHFESVTITCSTFDPGTAEGAGYRLAADRRPLVPTTIWIDGVIANLTVDRCVLGPVRARAPGNVETATISNSTLQALHGAAALVFADGTLALSRCTVMGQIMAHRFSASECILQERAVVDDLQDGCVRFSAWASGSALPRQYESVAIPPGAPLFTSTVFGQPGYAQLLPTADGQRLPPRTASTTPQNTISAGAADGSEMGAYARDKNPIRAQVLLLKLQEYMPANLTPVIVDVT